MLPTASERRTDMRYVFPETPNVFPLFGFFCRVAAFPDPDPKERGEGSGFAPLRCAIANRFPAVKKRTARRGEKTRVPTLADRRGA